MLFAPFLWKGAIALRALLLLNTAPASRPLRTVGSHRLLLGTAGVLMLGCAMDEYLYSDPVQPLSEDLPGLDFILDSMPKVLLLDAAPEVLLLDAAPLDSSEVNSYGSSISLVDVPELDWAVPETPTIRASEADTVQPSDDLLFDIYVFQYPRSPADAGEPFKPVAPTDDVPPVWKWKDPKLLLIRILLKKGRLPAHIGVGSLREILILALRGCCVVTMVATVLDMLVLCPAILWYAWRVYQEHRRRRRHLIR